MNVTQYFSDNYFEARKKFREKTKGFKKNRTNIIDDLTIDYALYNKPKKKKILIIASGVHGVEGYIGSGVQLYFLDKHFKKIKKEYNVALIHSLNPYGYKNNRRYNENNVDLNRNCIDDFSIFNQRVDILEKIEKYSLFNVYNPRISENLERIKYYKQILDSFFKIGISKTTEVLSFGQNRFPKGVCFAGLKKEKSTLAFEKYIKKITKGYNQAIFIDIHAGAAKKYDLGIYLSGEIKYDECRKLLRRIKGIKESKNVKRKGLNHVGGLDKFFLNKSMAKSNISIFFEYGTVNKYSTMLSLNYLSFLLVKENQITNLGPFSKLEKVRKEIKEAYYPNTEKYKKIILKKTDPFFKKLYSFKSKLNL